MKSKLTAVLFLMIFGLLSVIPQLSYCGGKEDNTVELLTPAPKPSPRLNGPLVYGCCPGHPFLTAFLARVNDRSVFQ